MDDLALAASIARLTEFRANWNRKGRISDHSGLTADDIDRILARLHETMGSAPVKHMQLSDWMEPEPVTKQWFNDADALSDADVSGEHGALQDGVDDDRKQALSDEIEKRGLHT